MVGEEWRGGAAESLCGLAKGDEIKSQYAIM